MTAIKESRDQIYRVATVDHEHGMSAERGRVSSLPVHGNSTTHLLQRGHNPASTHEIQVADVADTTQRPIDPPHVTDHTIEPMHTTQKEKSAETRPQNVLVPITQAAKLLLTSRVPALEDDGPKVGVEAQRVHLHAYRGDILLLELPRQMALHKGRLADASIAYQDELKLRRRDPSGRSGSLITRGTLKQRKWTRTGG